MTTPAHVLAADRASDRRRLFLGILVIGAMFSFGSTAQTMLMLETPPMSINGIELEPSFEATFRVSLNLLTTMCLGFFAAWVRLHDLKCALALTLALVFAAVAAVFRAMLQMATGVFPWGFDSPAIAGAFITVPIGFVTIAIGMAIVRLGRNAREADRARLEASVRASLALEELQQEELRVRREVADTLHGSLQNRFVLLETGIREVAERMRPDTDPAELQRLGARLLELSGELNALRERELREMSTALYPEALDRGLVPAARALVSRIPKTIPVNFSVEGMPTPDTLERTGRLLMVRAVEEGISNALRHGRASSIDMRIIQEDGEYRAEVRHVGFVPPEDRTLSGLERLNCRLSDYGGEIELSPEQTGGVLRARIPVPQIHPAPAPAEATAHSGTAHSGAFQPGAFQPGAFQPNAASDGQPQPQPTQQPQRRVSPWAAPGQHDEQHDPQGAPGRVGTVA